MQIENAATETRGEAGRTTDLSHSRKERKASKQRRQVRTFVLFFEARKEKKKNFRNACSADGGGKEQIGSVMLCQVKTV